MGAVCAALPPTKRIRIKFKTLDLDTNVLAFTSKSLTGLGVVILKSVLSDYGK